MERKILIFDSVPLMQHAYSGILGKDLQCNLTFAENELELEQKAKDGEYHLAIIDIVQKGRINWSLIKRVSRLNKKIKYCCLLTNF